MTPTSPASKPTLFFNIVMLLLAVVTTSAWSPNIDVSHTSFRKPLVLDESVDSTSIAPKTVETSVQNTRRRFFMNAAIIFGSTAITTASSVAAETTTATKYISGKTPQVPGEKKKKSDDTKGTRKDPNFLRSVSDCKNQCQTTPGSDGYSRSKEECLSECQDICCTSYEQCSFNIVPRI